MYHIIVNPCGGSGKGAKTLLEVENLLKQKNLEYIVHKTEYAGHATEIAKELSKMPDTKIIAIGGDGSFHEVLCGIENFENVTLGLIASGSGNDFIKRSYHPKDVEKAVDVILSGKTSYVDFLQLDNTRCLNVAGGGMDVDVLLKYADVKKLKGKAAYYYALFYTLAHTRFHLLRLTMGTEVRDIEAFMIGVGNGAFIGGGIPICPNAIVDDGKLDVVICKKMKRWQIPFRLPGLLSGHHVKENYVESYRCENVRIDILDDSKFELDGEIISDKTLNIQIVHNKLKVFK